jgi:hypothetical protein
MLQAPAPAQSGRLYQRAAASCFAGYLRFILCMNREISIAESSEFGQTASLQFAKRHKSTSVYDFAHLTGRLPCANLGDELNMYVGGTNGESRFKAGAVPQLYSWPNANCKLQSAICRESQKTRIRLFSTTFEVKGVGTSTVPPWLSSTPLADVRQGVFVSHRERPCQGASLFSELDGACAR